ncbi:hypothetical protein [Goodfellowiella coeruleoviolacea]|uniref:hypothetical protein n=1 Tax=Goodfellowiella coeruleoviolacea TaxID=334858 RepID=UPI0020A47A80|nr:hypothetical protein [Goodfellowiella coeruleoviolacea]
MLQLMAATRAAVVVNHGVPRAGHEARVMVDPLLTERVHRKTLATLVEPPGEDDHE